jgi:hypothetical protein
VGLLLILPELERSADLAAHIAQRALTGIGAQMTPVKPRDRAAHVRGGARFVEPRGCGRRGGAYRSPRTVPVRGYMPVGVLANDPRDIDRPHRSPAQVSWAGGAAGNQPPWV